MDIDEAIAKALDGEAVMFAGAGCSMGAVNILDDKIPLAGAFARHLANEVGLPDDTPLEDASDAYIDEFGDDALIRQIQLTFTAKQIAHYHQELGRIPWKRLYTTNYDNVLEKAHAHVGKRLSPVTASDDPYNIAKQETVCVHLNGYVDRLTRDNIKSEIKLTETSYLTASLIESPWTFLLRQDISYAKSVFFIGYSLADLDIRRILIDNPELKDKSFFILGDSPDALTVRHAERFGTIEKRSVESFVNLIANKRLTYNPAHHTGLSISAVREQKILPTGSNSKVTDQAFVNLMLYGNTNRGMLFESLTSGQRYILERKANDTVFEMVNAGKRVIVIHSDMGNGKSMMLESLRFRALERGFRVFEAKSRSYEAAEDLQKIAKLNEKVLITIEEYQDWLAEIRNFCLNATDRAVLILTARTAIHDLCADDLISATNLEDVPEIRLDAMSQSEIDWFVDALNEYGLWGEWARKSKEEKTSYIMRICRSQIHAILLEVLQSSHIRARLNQLMENLKKRKQEYEIFLSCCILTLLNQMPDYTTLVDLWGPDVLSSSRFRRSSELKQFLDFSQNEVLIKSPIAAKHILTDLAESSSTVWILTEMAKRAHEYSRISPRYDTMLQSLMKFSSVQTVLPVDKRAGAVINYYESIKSLPRCNNSPLFWLQYAIACLAISDLYRSKRYFETAYSLAEKHWFDTFQIDNHYARFLLEEAENNLELPDAMENFRKARTIVNRQVRDERRHYPYRVAALYQRFFDRFGSSLSPAQRDEISKAADYVLNMIESLPHERRTHKYTKECRKAMTYIIERVTRQAAQEANPA